MLISRDEVEKVARLARLSLSDEETARMTREMAQILAYVNLLSEVDTTAVEPMAHSSDVSNVFREDRIQPSLSREAALANAPRTDGECYLVPAMLAKEQ